MTAMRLIWTRGFCALILFWAGVAPAQDVPTDQVGFTAWVAARIQAAAPDLDAVVTGPLTLETHGHAGGATLYLSTLYAACQNQPPQADQLVAKFITDMVAVNETPDAAVDRTTLRVVVRPSVYVKTIDANGHGGSVATLLSGDLWVVAARDMPTAIAMLNGESLARLGLSRTAALEQGRANMRSQMRALLVQAQQQIQSGPNLLSGDPYEASLFAFPDLWAPLAKGFGGNLLVAVPASDVVLMIDGRSADAVASLRDAAQTVMTQADRPFDASLFRWTPTGWQPIP